MTHKSKRIDNFSSFVVFAVVFAAVTTGHVTVTIDEGRFVKVCEYLLAVSEAMKPGSRAHATGRAAETLVICV